MAIINHKNNKIVDFCGGDVYPAITLENKLPLIVFLEGTPEGMELEDLKGDVDEAQVAIRFDRAKDVEKCIRAFEWVKTVLQAFEKYDSEYYKH